MSINTVSELRFELGQYIKKYGDQKLLIYSGIEEKIIDICVGTNDNQEEICVMRIEKLVEK